MSIFSNIAGEFKTRNFSMYGLVTTCSRRLSGDIPGSCTRLGAGKGRYFGITPANQPNLLGIYGQWYTFLSPLSIQRAKHSSSRECRTAGWNVHC